MRGRVREGGQPQTPRPWPSPTPDPSPQGGGEPRIVAVVDIGKTNAKLALVAAESGSEIALRTTLNIVRQDGPYPHFDVEMIWDFLCGSLADLNREHPIDAISITAHGAGGALISGDPDGDGLALPIMDYEFAGPDELAPEYDAVRPDFSETLSPRLPAGLNLGAQLFWQQRRFLESFAAAEAFVTYAQYWAWRLSGIAANEVASLGSHTDLWRPREKTWSSMVERLGWTRLMAPVRSAFDRLGPMRPELSRRLGLSSDTPVVCGIHDSNASLLPHLLTREPPFSVVSTGTWVIVMAVGGSSDRLDPARDGLAYVNAFGDLVPAGRFMGGREFDLLTGGKPAEPTASDLDVVLSRHIMVLPSFTPGTGPFPHAKGRWSPASDTLSPGERSAAASLYLALITAECLEIADASGPVVIEGPFAANRLYTAALAGIVGRSIAASAERTGTTTGAALLATGGPTIRRPEPAIAEPLTHPAFSGYVGAWRQAARAV